MDKLLYLLLSLIGSFVLSYLAYAANIVDVTTAKMLGIIFVFSIIGGASNYFSELYRAGKFNFFKFLCAVAGMSGGGFFAVLLMAAFVGEDKVTMVYTLLAALAGGVVHGLLRMAGNTFFPRQTGHGIFWPLDG